MIYHVCMSPLLPSAHMPSVNMVQIEQKSSDEKHWKSVHKWNGVVTST